MSSRASFSRQMHRPHLDTIRALGYTLTLGDQLAWSGFSAVMAQNLTDEEIASIAYWALCRLDDDTAYLTASVALFGVMNGEVLA